MTDRSDRNRRFARMLAEAMGLGSLAGLVVLAPGCGGKVFLDVPSSTGGGGDGGAGGAGGSSATGTTTGTGGALCGDPPPSVQYGDLIEVCFPMDGDLCPPGSSPSVIDAAAKSLGLCGENGTGNCCGQGAVEQILCDLPPGPTECCYAADVVEDGFCVGRPFAVEGVARRASVTPRADWGAGPAAAPLPSLGSSRALLLRPASADLDPATRRALADAWAREAAFEHASIASFARLALELLAAGAPADLVREAQRAMGDEIRHAELGFSLASAYAGAPVGPGPLPIDGALGPTSLPDLAAATVREGCINETIAALAAAEARDAATDPAAREALRAIADDEAAHAAFAWRIVAWALQSGGAEVRAAVAEAFDAGWSGDGEVVEDPAGIDAAAMRAHGRLGPAEIRRIAMQAVDEVVRPSAAALLAAD